MEWQNYISQLLTEECSIDGITLSFGNNRESVKVPPIIKASILMLDKMMEHQGKFNIFVFPEKKQTAFIFALTKLLYNISEGRIDGDYKPEEFVIGERLRLGKAVAVFWGLVEINGNKFIRLGFKNGEYKAPFNIVPLLQKTKTERLSTDLKFYEEQKRVKRQEQTLSDKELNAKSLSDYKTHMDSSVVYVTTINNTKNLIDECKLYGQTLKDIILVGQVDYQGIVKNIGKGQLGGIPAVVLASDLYSVIAMFENGHPIQSIIIDIFNPNLLQSQLDALDELLRIRVPITCITDVVNSFDLSLLQDHGFNEWRWDETSITDNLYDVTTLSLDKKSKNCANRTVEYLVANGNEISRALELLCSHKNLSKTESSPMMKVFDKLFSLTFNVLRETVSISLDKLVSINDILVYCKNVIDSEKRYLSRDTYEKYSEIIDCLTNVYDRHYILNKHEILEKYLRECIDRTIAIVVPEGANKEVVQNYWQKWCNQNNLFLNIRVFYPADYYLLPCGKYEVTIVTGWFKRAIMQKILYSFNTRSYVILLYDYEKRWQSYTLRKWNSVLNGSRNSDMIEKAFNSDSIKIYFNTFNESESSSEEITTNDEYADIEFTLRENKYRQYIANGGQKSEDEVIEAVPVNYVGGYFAFYKIGHKIISATDIILNGSDKISTKFPTELRVGDFVVVRESDHDLIKEMADLMLESIGKSDIRELASKWKEAIKIKQIFSTNEEIYDNLVNIGCTRSYATVKGWLTDDDMIAPQSKEDLEHIAVVTQNGVLEEKLVQVYQAGRTVKAAHVRAGRELSSQLKRKIVDALKEHEEIDPFNIWQPIEMTVEGIGIVKILKIIDVVNEPVIVDIADTNRLIRE